MSEIAAYQDLSDEYLDAFCAECNAALLTRKETASFVRGGLLQPLTRYEARGLACWNCSRLIAPLSERP